MLSTEIGKNIHLLTLVVKFGMIVDGIVLPILARNLFKYRGPNIRPVNKNDIHIGRNSHDQNYIHG